MDEYIAFDSHKPAGRQAGMTGNDPNERCRS